MTPKKTPLALASALSGVVFATAAPPFDLVPAILVGLVGFAWTLDANDARTAARHGFSFGLAANVVALRFVPDVVARFTPLPWIAGVVLLLLLAAAQAIPWVIAGLVTSAVVRRALLPPFAAFAIGVYVACFVPAIFPWTPAGGLTPWPWTVQTAEIIGERGTSFLVAIIAGILVLGVRQTMRTAHVRAGAASFAIAAAVIAVMAVQGTLRMRAVERTRADATTVRMAAIQPAFDATDRWDPKRAAMMLERLTSLTKNAEQRGALLTVWPESAYPFTIAHGARREPAGARAVLQPGVRGPVLTGAYLSGGAGLGYNAAILVEPDGTLDPSADKRHLLWFGETVPLADVFPWLRRVFSRGTGLVAGKETVVLATSNIRAAVLNCYEDTLPAASREAMSVDPNVLVNVTNDAWFAGSSEGELHLRLSALRAIETRRDLVRAVNRGPTSFVDATGRVRARYDAPLPGPLMVDVALLETPRTPYARFGDVPLATLAVAAVGVAALRRRRS